MLAELRERRDDFLAAYYVQDRALLHLRGLDRRPGGDRLLHRDRGLPPVRKDPLALQHRRRPPRPARRQGGAEHRRARLPAQRHPPRGGTAASGGDGQAPHSPAPADRDPRCARAAAALRQGGQLVTFGCSADEMVRVTRSAPLLRIIRGSSPGMRSPTCSTAATSSSTCRCTRRSGAPRWRRWPAPARRSSPDRRCRSSSRLTSTPTRSTPSTRLRRSRLSASSCASPPGCAACRRRVGEPRRATRSGAPPSPVMVFSQEHARCFGGGRVAG